MRQRVAELIALDDEAGIATLRFTDDDSLREVEVPDQIQVVVGMSVKVIDIPGDKPMYAWGV